MKPVENKPDFSSKSGQKALRHALKNLMGFSPHYLPYYTTALTHRSITDDARNNNERLEFLGDAYIGAVVGTYLFKKYPTEDEGYLTEMRAKIVSRNSLNNIAKRIGLHHLLIFNHSDRPLGRSQIFGNALEALVGAIFLDRGYQKTRKFILSRLIEPNINMDELEHTDYNFKNKLYVWAQHKGITLEFVTRSENREGSRKVFTIAILADGKELSVATGYSKKEAGQTAAKIALTGLPEAGEQ